LIGSLIVIVLGFCGLAGFKAINFANGLLSPTPQDPLTNPRVVALLRLPEYQLAYPGAVLLGHFVSPPDDRPFSKEPAQASKTYGIHAPLPEHLSDQTIIGWYEQQLEARGWTLSSGGSLPDYSINRYWTNGHASVLIGVLTSSYIHEDEPSIDTTKYPLVFQLLFFD